MTLEISPFTHKPNDAPPIAQEVLAIDLDDTLYRTSEAFLAISALAAREKLCSRSTLNSARAAAEGTGQTFDLGAFLLTRGVSTEEISGLYNLFSSNQDPERFLYPDGLSLIHAIKQACTSAYVLTRGTDRQQTSKLLSAGLHDFPHVITDQLVKSRVIKATKNEENVYVIEARVAMGRSVILRAHGGTLIEDRPKGLVGLDGVQWNGILVQRRPLGELRMAQRGKPPPGSIVLHTLDPVTDQIMGGKLIGDMVRERLLARTN